MKGCECGRCVLGVLQVCCTTLCSDCSRQCRIILSEGSGDKESVKSRVDMGRWHLHSASQSTMSARIASSDTWKSRRMNGKHSQIWLMS